MSKAKPIAPKTPIRRTVNFTVDGERNLQELRQLLRASMPESIPLSDTDVVHVALALAPEAYRFGTARKAVKAKP